MVERPRLRRRGAQSKPSASTRWALASRAAFETMMQGRPESVGPESSEVVCSAVGAGDDLDVWIQRWRQHKADLDLAMEARLNVMTRDLCSSCR